MSNTVQVPVSSLLYSGLSSISSLPPVDASANSTTSDSGARDVFVSGLSGQGPDMRPVFHLNQYWSLMGQPVDMVAGQGPDMVAGQPVDMIAGQPVDM